MLSFKPLLVHSALLLALSGVAGSALAQEHLGPVDNVLLKNPYPNPGFEQFGSGVVAGDFDNDGISDLAVSEFGSTRMRILHGASFTVGTAHLFTFFPDTVNTQFHRYKMASGDFDGDGRDEIALGASTSTAGGETSAGLVYVWNRLVNGTWATQTTIVPGGNYPGAPQVEGLFGESLAAGDFDDDGYTDLAIGMVQQRVGGKDRAGAVMVVYGSAAGLSPVGALVIDRTTDGLTFPPKVDDYFGWALTAGDFDGDGDDDLAIGILNGTCPNGTDRAGAVVVLNGSPNVGINNSGSRIWRPGVQGVAGTCVGGSKFGSVLASGHFSASGLLAPPYDDLAIGAPATGTNNDGAVHVLYGTSAGLDVANNQRITAPPTAGFTSGKSWFGNSLATGRLARVCAGVTCAGDSLVVGAPEAIVNNLEKSGAVWVFDAGSNGRLNPSSARPILPLAPLKVGEPHQDARFGASLAIGDFNDDGSADLAIGVPNFDDGGETKAGAVQVLYQSDILFLNGFE